MAENETPRPTRTVSAADYDYLQTLDLKQISRLYYGKFLLRLTSILFWASGIYYVQYRFYLGRLDPLIGRSIFPVGRISSENCSLGRVGFLRFDDSRSFKNIC